MRFITWEAARTWASHFAVPDDAAGFPQVPAPGHASMTLNFEREPGHRLFYLAQEAVRALGPFDECLIWVTQTGIWPSNENWHLYYKLRSSYGDPHLLDERPAARALRYEEPDIISFVQLAMLFGWDMYLVTSHDYGRVFISHDGWYRLSEASPDVTATLGKNPSPSLEGQP